MQTEYNKEQVANLERQKIAIKDELEFTTNIKRIIDLEEKLYEVEDTISKLTNPARNDVKEINQTYKKRETDINQRTIRVWPLSIVVPACIIAILVGAWMGV